jgi:glycosyltransferase involved in cell wall biosynthesis
MTRLLVCSSTFPLSADDRRTARFVYDLAAALARRMDVVALAPHHGGAASRETLGPLEVRRFRYAWPARAQRLAAGSGVMPALRRSWLGRLQAPAYLFAFRRAAARLIASGGFDAVNSHWLVPAGWAVYRAAARARVPHLLTIHAADVFLLQRLPAGRRLAARIIRGAAACFADSAFINAELSELVGFEVGAYPATAGVDAAAFAPRYEPAAAKQLLSWPARPTVLFVGRMVEKKGLPYLVAAMAEVARARPEVRLVLAGDGPERAAAERQARELGLEDAVAFLGPKSHDELKLMYNAADWLVVPSIVDRHGETEGMPTVILEAFAAGCPVVGTRVAGIPEFVRDGETGFLAAPKDGDALAAALLRALGRGRAPFRAACLARAAAYDFAVLAELYEQALREAR